MLAIHKNKQGHKLIYSNPTRVSVKRILVTLAFSIAFAYIEAAVVVYLRLIFHPNGFTFPLADFESSPLWRQALVTESGREAATIVLVLSGAWLFGQNLQLRLAYFLEMFAIWDIFYYLWLKLLINWPSSITDWDILFLLPLPWAGPVWAPIVISLTMFVFAMIIFYRHNHAKPLRLSFLDRLGLIAAALIIVVSFCIAAVHMTKTDYQSHFYWPLFVLGYISAVALFAKCLFRSK